MTDTSKLIEGRTGPWEIVLGLEIHAQVASNAKLFSGAAVGFGAEPNAQVSLVDAAMPGMLPVINRRCVEQAVRTGLGLKAQINLKSRFDRKNYFYPDLPQGYQISQFKEPIVGEGEVLVERDDGSTFKVGIERLHLEQDAGKSLHDQDPNATYVDLNRAGTALMEIVSRPDMRSSEEAAAYVKKLRTILVYLGTCDGDMEKGNLRADVNVSVRKPGDEFGTRTETKNVNSIRFVMQAIEHEASRQVDVLESGGKIVQETRLFNPDTGTTRSMRSKEDAHDYRYFPDPDLLPLELDDAFLEACRASLPELPGAKRARYEGQGITPYQANVLTAEVEIARWFDTLLDQGAKPVAAANWVSSELFGALNRLGKDITESPVSPGQAAELLALIGDGTLSGTLAKQVFEVMLETGDAPGKIVEERGLKQTSDTGAIEAVIADVLAKNPNQLEQYRGGKEALFGFFVGQTMKAMGGKANPGVVNELLKKALS